MFKRLGAVLLIMATVMGVATVAAARSRPTQPGPAGTISPDLARTLADTPPNGQLTVIVRLRSKATLAGATHGTRAERQRAAIDDLRQTANVAQVSLRSYLDGSRAQHRVSKYQPFWVFDGMSVTATPDVIRELATRADVESISPDAIDVVQTAAPVAPAEPNVAKVNAPSVWAQGYYGQGVVVASLDSGVDVSHPDLAPSYRGGSNSWFDPYSQHATPTDLSGHGTETMGVIVGGQTGGTTIGVAPGATWIAGRVFNDAGTATATAIHSALQWVLDPDRNPATADAPQVVNNSWAYGTPGCNLEFRPDLQALRAAGIVPVFAAGNYGPGSSSSVSPANYPEALSVGATNLNDTVYAYSSRGPAACGEASATYPDLVAPGVNIHTTERFGMYSVATGTSLSAPHVTGAIAVLVSTGLANAVTAEQTLLSTAIDLGAAGADNAFGRGRIDLAAALASLQGTPPPTTTTTTTSTTVPATTTTSTTVPATTTTSTTVPATTTTTTSTTVPATTTTTTTIPAPPNDQIFADGFESGSMSAWSGAVTNSGRLSVSTTAALAGTYGLRASISNRNDMYVVDTTPAAVSSYHARFVFDPNSAVIGSGKVHDIFVALDASGASNLRIQVAPRSRGYQLRTGTTLDSGVVTYSTWVNITDSPHNVEVSWIAATGSSAGTATLYVDGSPSAVVTGLVDGSRRIDTVRLGVQNVPTGVSGTEYFDAFASTRSSYVGPTAVAIRALSVGVRPSRQPSLRSVLRLSTRYTSRPS